MLCDRDGVCQGEGGFQGGSACFDCTFVLVKTFFTSFFWFTDGAILFRDFFSEKRVAFLLFCWLIRSRMAMICSCMEIRRRLSGSVGDSH